MNAPVNVLVEPAPAAEPQRRAMFRQLLRNCFSILIRGVGQAVFILVMTPYILHRLGDEQFGIWGLVYTFVPYAALFDWGISGALAKFCGELDTRLHARRVRSLFASALLAEMGLSTIFALLLFVMGHFGHGGFLGKLPPGLLPLIWILFMSAMFSNLMSYALLGLHRQDLASYVSLVFLLISGIGIFLIFEMGYGLKALILLSAFIAMATAIASWRLFSSLIPSSSWRWQLSDMLKLLRFGTYLQFYALVSLFYLYFGKLALAYSVTLTAVASYEIALRLTTIVRQGFSTMASPLLPATARLSGENDTATLGKLFIASYRTVSLLSLPIFSALAFFAEPILRQWVGRGHEASLIVMRLLPCAFYFGSLSTIVWFFLVGSGIPAGAVAVSMFEASLGIIATAALVKTFGIGGAALAAVLSAGLSLPLYLRLLRKQCAFSAAKLFGKNMAVPLGMSVGLAWAVRLILSDTLLACLVFIALCYVMFWASGILADEEKEAIRGWILARPLHSAALGVRS